MIRIEINLGNVADLTPFDPATGIDSVSGDGIGAIETSLPTGPQTGPTATPVSRIEAGIKSFIDSIRTDSSSSHELVVEPYHLVASFTPVDPSVEGSYPHVEIRLDLEDKSPLWHSSRMAHLLPTVHAALVEGLAILPGTIGLTDKNIRASYSGQLATYLEEKVYGEWRCLEKLSERTLVDLDAFPDADDRDHKASLRKLLNAAESLAAFVKNGRSLCRGLSENFSGTWHGVASVLHDCNNFLTPVMGLVEIALMDIKKARKGNYRGLQIPNTMGRIVETICNRQSSGFQKLHPQLTINFPVELNQLSLLDTDERFAVRRMLTNLVVNAIKNGKPGVPPVVRVRSGFVDYQAKPHLAFVVEDEGMGMKPNFMRKELGQSGKRAGAYEGDGQGVSGSLRLLHSLGGHMRVASVKGEGSSFALVIPVDRLQLGVANGADKMGLIDQSPLDLKGMTHLPLFKDEPNCFQKGNLFVVGEKHWDLEMKANFISDAPFEILYFALPEKIRDFVPEEAHLLFSVGAMRVAQSLPFMPKSGAGSLKGMASLMAPMMLASMGWDVIGRASGIQTLEQGGLANNLFLSATGTAFQYGVHRLGLTKTLPYFGYALGADILLGGLFALATLAMEQGGKGSMAAYRLDHLVWNRVIGKNLGEMPWVGEPLAMAAGVFSNTSYALGYLYAQMVDPDLLDDVDQLKDQMVKNANLEAERIIQEAKKQPQNLADPKYQEKFAAYIQNELWEQRHDGGLDTLSFYTVADGGRYSHPKSPLSLLTKTFDYKAHWSSGTRRIQVVDEEALAELTKINSI